MSEKDHEAQLTLKDRVNFPYLLARQIITVQQTILKVEFSEREIQESVQGLANLIPTLWKDESFKEEMKAATSIKKLDSRQYCCGYPLEPSDGSDGFKEVSVYDWWKVFQACINLLNRKQMITKIQRIEKLEDVNFEQIKDNAVLQS